MRWFAVTGVMSLACLWSCSTTPESTAPATSVDEGVVQISEQEMAYYQQFGQHIVADAQGKIFRKLSEVLTALGPAKAVQFCKTNAKVFTGEFGVEHEVNIKRATDKVRNPYNRATPVELEKIAVFKKSNIENPSGLPPAIVVAHDKTVDYYAPIKTNVLCLNCHGQKESLDPELLKRLSVWYPLDQATGYNINEIRGVWHVSFPKPEVVAKTSALAKESAIKDASKLLGSSTAAPSAVERSEKDGLPSPNMTVNEQVTTETMKASPPPQAPQPNSTDSVTPPQLPSIAEPNSHDAK